MSHPFAGAFIVVRVHAMCVMCWCGGWGGVRGRGHTVITWDQYTILQCPPVLQTTSPTRKGYSLLEGCNGVWGLRTEWVLLYCGIRGDRAHLHTCYQCTLCYHPFTSVS